MEADQLRCVLGTLAGNDTATVNVSVWARQSGFLTNTVVLSSAIRDATPTNTAAQAVVYVAAPTLSAANVSAPEAAGQVVRFTVNLTPLSARTSLVQFATADISAIAGVDYQPTNGVLMFFPGETSKTISVRIMDDVADEPNEDFALTFYNPINVNITTPRVVGTIVDNDNAPSLTIADANVTEGNSGLTPLQFRLQLSAISGQLVEVDFATANGSAVAPGDYVATNGTVTFVPGEITRLLPVFVQGERLNETTESFAVNLSFPFNATISDGTAVGTILNDDFLPTFSVVNDLIAVESCATNRAIDPGETVTLSFTFRNIATGGARATNLIATLQPTGGVLAPSPAVVLGPVVPGGIVTNRFTFTADALCGEIVIATFLLEDNQVGLGSVSVPLRVGQPVTELAENFDGVPAPALPAGWTTATMGATTPWHTTASVRDTLPNAVMTSNPSIRTTNDLISPPVSIATLNARLTFRHSFDTEEAFDGGILEISVENGPFTEWLTAGGEFVEGAYNGDIDFFEPGWTGNSGGFQTVVATLPPTAVEHTVRFRWRFTSDSSVGGVGWFVDSISMVDGYLCCEPSPLLLTDISTDGTAVTLRWDSMPNRLYRIQYKPSLNATEWIDLPGDVQATGATSTWLDRSPPTAQRFYRVVQLP